MGVVVEQKAEFSPWMLEFKRLDRILTNLHEAKLSITENQMMIIKTYDLMEELWRVLRPRISIKGDTDLTRESIDNRMKVLEKHVAEDITLMMTRRNEHVKETTYDELKTLYDDLYLVREMVGLGVPMYSQVDDYDYKYKKLVDDPL